MHLVLTFLRKERREGNQLLAAFGRWLGRGDFSHMPLIAPKEAKNCIENLFQLYPDASIRAT